MSNYFSQTEREIEITKWETMDLNPHIPKVGSQLTSGPRNDPHYFLA